MSYFRRQYIFPGQQENEEICLVIRQHPIVLVGQMLFALLFFGIYIGISVLLNRFIIPDINPVYAKIISIGKDVYLLFLFLGTFISWIIYYLNVQIVTNQRVVEITQNGLLSHTVSELDLNHIEDVTTEVKGFLATMFNFGNVYIQTAAEKERFIFSNVPRPTDIQKLILDLYEKLPENSNPVHNPASKAI